MDPLTKEMEKKDKKHTSRRKAPSGAKKRGKDELVTEFTKFYDKMKGKFENDAKNHQVIRKMILRMCEEFPPTDPQDIDTLNSYIMLNNRKLKNSNLKPLDLIHDESKFTMDAPPTPTMDMSMHDVVPLSMKNNELGQVELDSDEERSINFESK
tara:strand:+ start:224 stop:685 length:462 start_codon:yes stop_codon:yes gene_type:complete